MIGRLIQYAYTVLRPCLRFKETKTFISIQGCFISVHFHGEMR